MHLVLADGDTALHEQLGNEARHLAARDAIGHGGIHQADAAGTLHEAVEIIGKDGRAAAHGGEGKGLAQFVGDERIVATLARQVALGGGKHEHAVEVEQARFEHAHNLQAFEGFAMQGQIGLHQHRAQKAQERLGRNVE